MAGMNQYQKTLYDELMHLVENNEAFFYSDFQLDDEWYRIFNYRLASYTDFLQPSALECRGTMFEIIHPDRPVPIRLASLPFEKFFNLYENPFTMDLDLSDIVEIADKADGSLITTYTHHDVLQVKTKGSLFSDQAINANAFLRLEENAVFRHELMRAEKLAFTVIKEWCAPNNRIVLPYMEPHLKVLGVRYREDGSYVEFEEIDDHHFPEILKRWVKIIPAEDPEAYINAVDDMQGVEGVVFRLANGQRVKKKSTWYLALHHTKDSINTPRRLYEAVLEEATDDMRSLFHDDPLAIKMIAEMEEFVEVRYNHLVDTVERFYERNKDLERKEYAILGQEELNKMQFGLAMSKYLGKSISYKEAMKKAWKHYGLKDEKVEDNE
jgi:T4 RnlA family RNA ligase